ncbi:MAG: hypothetical protein AAFO75_03105 [Pseudomonadota bacterium]
MSKGLFSSRRVLWMPLDFDWQPPSGAVTHCCQELAVALVFDCDTHADPFDCPDTVIVFHELFGEYGLPIRDGGASYLVLSHCPFCGFQFPASGRDAWFDALEAAGLDDVAFTELPEEFQTTAWRFS